MQSLPNKNIFYALIGVVALEIIVGVFYLLTPSTKTKVSTTVNPKVTLPVQNSTSSAIVSILPASLQVSVSQSNTLQINIDTDKKEIAGADVILNYDPEKIEINKADITPGNITETFANVVVDTSKKQIVISGFTDPKLPFSGKGVFANINFKALEVGLVKLTPLFVAPGDTKDTNVVEKGIGKDILSKVAGSAITIIAK